MHVVNIVSGSKSTFKTIDNIDRIRIPHLNKPLGSKTGTSSVLAIDTNCSLWLLDHIGDNPFKPATFNIQGARKVPGVKLDLRFKIFYSFWNKKRADKKD